MFGLGKKIEAKPRDHDHEFKSFLEEHNSDIIYLVYFQIGLVDFSDGEGRFCTLPRRLTAKIGCLSNEIGIFDFIFNGAVLFSTHIRLDSGGKDYRKATLKDYKISYLSIDYKEKLSDRSEKVLLRYDGKSFVFNDLIYKKEDLYTIFYKCMKPLLYKAKVRGKEKEILKILANKERETQRLLKLEKNSEKVQTFIREYEGAI